MEAYGATVRIHGNDGVEAEIKAREVAKVMTQSEKVVFINKTCHRDRIARLTAPCPSHKKHNVRTLTFANADADAGGSTIALPGLLPGELKSTGFPLG